MKLRQAGLAILVIFVLILSGCAGESSASASAKARKAAAAKNAQGGSIDTDLEKALKTALQRPGMGDLRTWYALSVNATMEGGVAAFEWFIPEGAAQHSRFSQEIKNVYLEVAPIVFEKPPTDWGLFVFRVQEGKVVAAGALTRSATESVSSSVVPGTPVTRPASDLPTFFSFSGLRLQDGEKVYMLLAAAGIEAPFGVAFSVRDEAPGFETVPPADLPDFLDDAKGLPARSLALIGTGSGLAFGAYTEFNAFFAPSSVFSSTSRSGSVKMVSRLPVEPRLLVSARDMTLSVDAPLTEGWTRSNGIYFGDDAGGRWGARLESHGVSRTFKGLVVQSGAPFSSLVTRTAFGFSMFNAVGDGSGKAITEFEIAAANRNEFEILTFFHLSLGVSLKSLLGIEAQTMMVGLVSPAGNLPPTQITWRGGDVVLESPDFIMTMPAAAPPWHLLPGQSD